MILNVKIIDKNQSLGVVLMDGPKGVRLVNVSTDWPGPTGYYNGVLIKDLPVERLVSMFPSSEDYLYEYCGTQEYEI